MCVLNIHATHTLKTFFRKNNKIERGKEEERKLRLYLYIFLKLSRDIKEY